MERVTKDEYYLEIAKAVSLRSTCLKRQYGCVIVNNDEIISTGYNGSPRGEINCCDKGYCKRLKEPNNSGHYDECFSVHAEQNAMLSASRKEMIGSTLYLFGYDIYEDKLSESCPGLKEKTKIEIKAEPCPICLRMAKNAGIKKIVNKDGEICL